MVRWRRASEQGWCGEAVAAPATRVGAALERWRLTDHDRNEWSNAPAHLVKIPDDHQVPLGWLSCAACRGGGGGDGIGGGSLLLLCALPLGCVLHR